MTGWQNEWRDMAIYNDYRMGLTRGEICDKYGLDSSTVHRILYRAAHHMGEKIEVELSPKNMLRFKMYVSGVHTEVIAEHYDVSRQSIDYGVKRTAKALGLDWQEVKEMRDKGKYYVEELSKKLGSSRSANMQVVTEVIEEAAENRENAVGELAVQPFIDLLGDRAVLGQDDYNKDETIEKIRQQLGGSSEDVIRLSVEYLLHVLSDKVAERGFTNQHR